MRGVGRRQAPEEFLQNCDAFMYIDPANRFELLDNEGLVRREKKQYYFEKTNKEKVVFIFFLKKQE